MDSSDSSSEEKSAADSGVDVVAVVAIIAAVVVCLSLLGCFLIWFFRVRDSNRALTPKQAKSQMVAMAQSNVALKMPVNEGQAMHKFQSLTRDSRHS